MRLVGKNAELMKMVTKINGNVAPTASWEPVRMASTWLIPPMTSTKRDDTASNTRTAAGPPAISAPNTMKTATITRVLPAATIAAPARRPTRTGTRATGEASSRSRNPFSMSRANSIPAELAPNETAWRIEAGRMKSRNDSTSGKPGRPSARWNWRV